MTIVEEPQRAGQVVYQLEGTILEACSCGVLCPCWIGEDPDGGECFGLVSYHFDRGQVAGVGVSGLNFVMVAHLPGNVLAGGWRVVFVVDDRATDVQRAVLESLYRGELGGGPIADLATLIGEVVAVERAAIRHHVEGGKGTLVIPGVLEAEMEPYRGPDGITTTLRDSIFSTTPGSPAYVAKAGRNSVTLPEYGLEWEFEGRNAIQADYVIEHRG